MTSTECGHRTNECDSGDIVVGQRRHLCAMPQKKFCTDKIERSNRTRQPTFAKWSMSIARELSFPYNKLTVKMIVWLCGWPRLLSGSARKKKIIHSDACSMYTTHYRLMVAECWVTGFVDEIDVFFLLFVVVDAFFCVASLVVQHELDTRKMRERLWKRPIQNNAKQIIFHVPIAGTLLLWSFSVCCDQ